MKIHLRSRTPTKSVCGRQGLFGALKTNIQHCTCNGCLRILEIRKKNRMRSA